MYSQLRSNVVAHMADTIVYHSVRPIVIGTSAHWLLGSMWELFLNSPQLVSFHGKRNHVSFVW